MQMSPSITALATALAQAQAEIKSITKDRTNPHFKNRYATLDAILDTIRPVLARQGLSVVQGASESEQGVHVETVLLHASGEYVANVVAVPIGKRDAQGVGSALTYGRRYGVSALLALSTDEDDDGEQAVKPPATPAKKPEPKPDAKAKLAAEWDGTDQDALRYPFPVEGSPHHNKPMGEMPTEALQKFIEWAGVKPQFLHVRTRAEAILTHRSK